MGIAIAVMVGALGIGGLVLLASIAVDMRRGVGIWSEILRLLDGRAPGESVPTLGPSAPFDRALAIASARRVYEASRRAEEEGQPGKREGQQRVQLGMEATPVVDELDDASPMARSVEVAAFRQVPEVPPLGEDEEDTRTWERQSGTWKVER